MYRDQLNNHITETHKNNHQQNKCQHCNFTSRGGCHLKNHVKSSHETQKEFKCKNCGNVKSKKKIEKSLKIGSLNIGRGLLTKEELLINTI